MFDFPTHIFPRISKHRASCTEYPTYIYLKLNRTVGRGVPQILGPWRKRAVRTKLPPTDSLPNPYSTVAECLFKWATDPRTCVSGRTTSGRFKSTRTRRTTRSQSVSQSPCLELEPPSPPSPAPRKRSVFSLFARLEEYDVPEAFGSTAATVPTQVQGYGIWASLLR